MLQALVCALIINAILLILLYRQGRVLRRYQDILVEEAMDRHPSRRKTDRIV